MRELGPDELLFHRQTGEYAAAAGVRAIWGVGTLSGSTAEGFRSAAAAAAGEDPGEAARGLAGHVGSSAESLPVESSLRPGDVVLFKASRGVGLEEMVERVAGLARAGRWAGATGEPSSE
jgi:UDP-N-acetylmuramoyl-tripeptide--D-alanyl-D-alanine ligase